MLHKPALIFLLALLSIPACQKEAPVPQKCDMLLFTDVFTGENIKNDLNLRLMRQWLDDKCPINVFLYKDLSILQLAVITGDLDMVKRALDQGAHVDAKGSARFVPLSWSIIHGHKEITKLLLDKGADIDGGQNPSTFPLYHSLRDPVLFDDLIARGADIHRVDEHGNSVLHGAAESKTGAEFIRKLIALKADIDLLNKKGRSPIIFAARKGNEAELKVLINAGAKLELRDENYMTVLAHAQQQDREGAIKIIKAAIKKLYQPPPADAPTEVLIYPACKAALDEKFPGWKLAKIWDEDIHKSAAFNKYNPWVAIGDFDGNGKSDRAVLLASPPRNKVAVCLAHDGKTQILEIKKPYCGDLVYTKKAKSKVFDYETDKHELLKSDGISVSCFEKAGATYVLEQGKFRRIVDSD